MSSETFLFIIIAYNYLLRLATRVLKRLQETDPRKDSKATGNVTRKNAADLEHENMEYHLKALYVPISESRTVHISVDGDCKIKKLIQEIDKENFEIELFFDQAHLAKNVPKNVTAIVKANNYHGSGDGRIGKQNLYRLINAIQAAVKKCCKKTTKIPSSEERNDPKVKQWVEKEMQIVKQHVTGDHSECELGGQNCSATTILRVYPGKYSDTKLKKLVESLFDHKYLKSTFIHEVVMAGCTSKNESFHALLVNRRLIVKGEGIHVSANNFDASIAVGSLIWNLGQIEAYRKSLESVGWTISETALRKLDMQERKQAKKTIKNLSLKPQIRAKRMRNQCQYTDTSKYRTSLQQADDLASRTIKRLKRK